MEIQAAGFKKFVRDGILLETGETTTLSASLEVGELSECVTVTGERTQVAPRSQAIQGRGTVAPRHEFK